MAYLVAHPIQYQAPLLRRIAETPEVELEVFFLSDYTARDHVDPGFGRRLDWDVPLLDGYSSQALTAVEGVRARRPFVPDVWRRIGGARFDALWVHGWTQVTQLAAMAGAWRSGVPILVRGESKPEPRGLCKRTVLRSLFRRVAGALAIGSENRAFYRSHGVPEERIHAMPYAVDVPFFRDRVVAAAPQRDQLRTELGIAPGAPVLLFASKLIERKAPLELLEAYRRLSPDGVRAPEAHLVFVGDGPDRTLLEAAVAKTGWDTIHLAGFRNQTELPAFYGLADAFVLPSRYETWGLVLNEAMCASRPVITTTAVGAAVDLVQPGRTGYVYESGDVAALTRCLRDLLERPDRGRAMGRAAAERIADWDLSRSRDGFLRALEEVRAA